MKKLISCILFVVLGWVASAQEKSKVIISVGGVIPIGSYASMSFDPSTLATDCGLFDVDAGTGGAATGVDFGIQLVTPLQGNGLAFTLSADLVYNPMGHQAQSLMVDLSHMVDNSLVNEVVSGGYTSTSSSCSIEKKLGYWNVPVFAGLRYGRPAGTMSWYLELGVGANFRFVSPLRFLERIQYEDDLYYYQMNMYEEFGYSPAGTLAARLGGGIDLTDHLSLSAYYYYLGKGSVSSKIAAWIQDDSSIQPVVQDVMLGTVTPMMLVAKLGYKF